jgi:hypothetical protein
MTFNTARLHGAPVLAVTAMLLLTMASPHAQRRRGGGDGDAGAPVATNTILANPQLYYGKPVTISAGVEQVLSKTAFVVDQRKAVSDKEVQAIGMPILVLAPTLIGTVETKRYVLLKGQVVKFDAAAVARLAPGYQLDLAADFVTKYQGQPVLLATSVIDSTYAELTRKVEEAKPEPAKKASVATEAPRSEAASK